ncbi:hypothetical protein LTR37_009725 [Vermiconidia calcicola]|uniref:Uncharacterized protein n=1 Tax=Vermiconidia calcicola TaxID=1690605 RepID=A0ACC3N7E2_9PEZI|nr:hypothetical protein LTR37_009725 [Vermiconidia calcicola]
MERPRPSGICWSSFENQHPTSIVHLWPPFDFQRANYASDRPVSASWVDTESAYSQEQSGTQQVYFQAASKQSQQERMDSLMEFVENEIGLAAIQGSTSFATHEGVRARNTASTEPNPTSATRSDSSGEREFSTSQDDQPSTDDGYEVTPVQARKGPERSCWFRLHRLVQPNVTLNQHLLAKSKMRVELKAAKRRIKRSRSCFG